VIRVLKAKMAHNLEMAPNLEMDRKTGGGSNSFGGVGWLEQVWDSVKNGASNAWDWITDAPGYFLGLVRRSIWRRL